MQEERIALNNSLKETRKEYYDAMDAEAEAGRKADEAVRVVSESERHEAEEVRKVSKYGQKPKDLFDKYPRDKAYFDAQNAMRNDATRFANMLSDPALYAQTDDVKRDAATMREEPSL